MPFDLELHKAAHPPIAGRDADAQLSKDSFLIVLDPVPGKDRKAPRMLLIPLREPRAPLQSPYFAFLMVVKANLGLKGARADCEIICA